MKFTWFNLMPWPYLPDDFREKNRSVWVDIPNTLYDPRRGHFVYHEYMDQLEYADALGFDGIGVNEHHQNGYGLMPSPNIIAAGLARRTSRAALCVIGNSIALYNPPIRVAEEFAMLDVLSGGRLVAGFPVGTLHGHQLLLRPDPGPDAREVPRGPRADHAGLGRRRALRLRRQVHPAPLGQLLAQADPEAASADLHPGRRVHRDVGLLPGLRLQLLVPLVLRLPQGQVAARRLLGPRGQAGQGRVALPRGLRPDHLRGRHRPRGGGALRRARALLLQPVPARLSALRGSARLSHHQHHQVRGPLPALARAPGHPREPHLEAARRGALHRGGQPRHRAPAAGGGHQGPARGPPLLSLPQRQHARLEDPALVQALRRARHAEAARPLAGVEGRRPLVDLPHGRPPAPGGGAAGRGEAAAGRRERSR